MSFSSFTFIIFFFPLFFVLYTLTPARWKNLALILASFLFYGWATPIGALILCVGIIFDYYIVGFLKSAISPLRKKVLMAAGVSVNVGLLVYYKYSGFFAGELNHCFSYLGINTIPWTEVLLPLGISFFVFHKISYIMDVYFDAAEPAESIQDYALYVVMFPKLIMGPITKYRDMRKQLIHHPHSLDHIFEGLFRFCIGLSKKVLIADSLALTASAVFNMNHAELPVSYAWLGIICYTFQIYFDFAGYSDMAIGIGRMLGFSIPENFNRPYIAASFTEFWQRWHITLSAWFREYLYIPLGGNRVSRGRTYLNLWIVFLMSGLWHGANWTFIFWGAYHGFFLVVDKVFWLERSRKIGKLIATPLTFIFIMIGWVFFRSSSFSAAIGYLSRMFDFSAVGRIVTDVPLQEIITQRGIFILVIASFFSFVPEKPLQRLVSYFAAHKNKVWFATLQMIVFVILTVLCICSISSSNFTPFIYFRF